MNKVSVAIMFTTALVACGAQGPAAGRVRIDSPLKSQPAVPSIGMYGDSTMLGITKETGEYAVTSRNAPAQLQAMLSAAGYQVTVTNHGVSGSASYDLLNGTGGFPRSWVAEMKSTPHTAVVINMGLNDAALIMTKWDTVANFKATMNQLVKIAQQQGKTVFIETPNPRNDKFSSSLMDQIAAADLQVVRENRGTLLIDQYARIQADMPNWRQNLPDRIHPDDVLYTFKASVEFSSIMQILTLPAAPGPNSAHQRKAARQHSDQRPMSH